MTRTQLMTSAEVAAELRRSVDTIQRAAASGSLPAIRVGRRWLFNRETIERLVAAAR